MGGSTRDITNIYYITVSAQGIRIESIQNFDSYLTHTRSHSNSNPYIHTTWIQLTAGLDVLQIYACKLDLAKWWNWYRILEFQHKLYSIVS